MASIFKRKNKNGTTVWRAVIRIKGYPSVCNHFERKQEADDWAQEIERQIKTGRFKFDQHNKIHTVDELIERYIQDGVLEHHRSSKDTHRHLKYWKSRFEKYDLIHITTEFIGKERQILMAIPSKDPHLLLTATCLRFLLFLLMQLNISTGSMKIPYYV